MKDLPHPSPAGSLLWEAPGSRQQPRPRTGRGIQRSDSLVLVPTGWCIRPKSEDTQRPREFTCAVSEARDRKQLQPRARKLESQNWKPAMPRSWTAWSHATDNFPRTNPPLELVQISFPYKWAIINNIASLSYFFFTLWRLSSQNGVSLGKSTSSHLLHFNWVKEEKNMVSPLLAATVTADRAQRVWSDHIWPEGGFEEDLQFLGFPWPQAQMSSGRHPPIKKKKSYMVCLRARHALYTLLNAVFLSLRTNPILWCFLIKKRDRFCIWTGLSVFPWRSHASAVGTAVIAPSLSGRSSETSLCHARSSPHWFLLGKPQHCSVINCSGLVTW